MSYAATSTTGRDNTYKFKFSYDEATETLHNDDLAQYKALPAAKTILITFPLKGHGQSPYLHKTYVQTHGGASGAINFIQLGTSGIFTIPHQDMWVTRHSRYDTNNLRAIAEDELKALGGCVLNLSGLWGGERQVRHWIDRVAKTKAMLREKTSLHMIHGLDVARAIVAVHEDFSKAAGERYVSSQRT
jgi:hypothetical protein